MHGFFGPHESAPKQHLDLCSDFCLCGPSAWTMEHVSCAVIAGIEKCSVRANSAGAIFSHELLFCSMFIAVIVDICLQVTVGLSLTGGTQLSSGQLEINWRRVGPRQQHSWWRAFILLSQMVRDGHIRCNVMSCDIALWWTAVPLPSWAWCWMKTGWDPVSSWAEHFAFFGDMKHSWPLINNATSMMVLFCDI